MEQLLFLLLAVTAIGASLALIASRTPVYSAMFMVVVFVATAIMFLVLQAPFMAALQIIVYAGAIVVLFLFVISFLSLKNEGLFERRRAPMLLAAGLAILLAGELAAAVATLGGMGGFGDAGARQAPGAEAAPAFGSVESVATLLFQDYVVPFEITSVLLIVAMVGAVVLARRVTAGAGATDVAQAGVSATAAAGAGARGRGGIEDAPAATAGEDA